jgi:hypothetical protein
MNSQFLSKSWMETIRSCKVLQFRKNILMRMKMMRPAPSSLRSSSCSGCVCVYGEFSPQPIILLNDDLVMHGERYSAHSPFMHIEIFSDKHSRRTLASLRATGFVPSVGEVGTLHLQRMKGQALSPTKQPAAYLPDTSLNSERSNVCDLKAFGLPEESARSVSETFSTNLPSASFIRRSILMEIKSRSVCLRVAHS